MFKTIYCFYCVVCLKKIRKTCYFSRREIVGRNQGLGEIFGLKDQTRPEQSGQTDLGRRP